MKKLLLVDDELVFRRFLSIRFRALVENIEIAAVSSCEEAFESLRTDAGFDLILVDLTLGSSGLSGAAGIRRLRKDYPETPVVALSESTDSGVMRATIDDGAMGFIPRWLRMISALGAAAYCRPQWDLRASGGAF